MRALQISLIVGACGVAAVTVACGSATQTRSRNGAGCRETKAVAAYASAIKTAMPLVRRLAAGIRAPGCDLADVLARVLANVVFVVQRTGDGRDGHPRACCDVLDRRPPGHC
jgi:hypothetical protein